jgi:hypothetical protein
MSYRTKVSVYELSTNSAKYDWNSKKGGSGVIMPGIQGIMTNDGRRFITTEAIQSSSYVSEERMKTCLSARIDEEYIYSSL